MAQIPRRTGVCLIRVEAQAASFLITVRQNPDIDRRSGELVTTFADVELALAAARAFLERFITSAPPRPRPKS